MALIKKRWSPLESARQKKIAFTVSTMAQPTFSTLEQEVIALLHTHKS
jgi:hypothetical protein